jgi:hypothetical protein
MIEHPDDEKPGPMDSVAREVGGITEAAKSHALYLRRVDRLRKVVAIGMAVCGLGFVACVNCDDHLRITLRESSGLWAWGIWPFGIGVVICLVTTLALVVEYLVRPYLTGPSGPQPFTLRSFVVLLAVVAVCIGMVTAFGVMQAVGTGVSAFLLLASVRERGAARTMLGVMSAIVIALTLWSTQSAYQYARRHADEVVAAGCELMDQVPVRKYESVEIQLSDPRIPRVLRKLGPESIAVHTDYVWVHLGGIGGEGFHIYRNPHPHALGKAETVKINDRLWYL